MKYLVIATRYNKVLYAQGPFTYEQAQARKQAAITTGFHSSDVRKYIHIVPLEEESYADASPDR